MAETGNDNQVPAAPRAKKKRQTSIHHGIEKHDDYAWLRADNWQEVMTDPEQLDGDIRAYLEAENSYYDSRFADHTGDIRHTIYREIRGQMKEDDSGVPSPDGPYSYFSRMVEGQQYPLLVRTPREGGAETVLLDCNREAGDGYFGFGGASHSPCHGLLAWSADANGSEFYQIRIRDLSRSLDLDDRLDNTAGGVVWAADSKSLFYVVQDENHRPFRVMRHHRGTPQEADDIVYEEKDKGFFTSIGRSLDGRFLVISAGDHQTSEVWLVPTGDKAPPRLVAERVPGREYDVCIHQDSLFILTNAEGAEDFKIVTAPLDAPGPENWRDVVPHRAGILVVGFFTIRDHLIRLEQENGLPRIIIRQLADGGERPIDFDEKAYSLGVGAGYEFDTNTIRFTYSSPTTPSRIYDYDLSSGQRTLRKEQEIPSGHDRTAYVTDRIFVAAPDGEEVPVTLLRHRSTPLDGTAPCLLYGYGAYGMSMPASFSISTLSLVQRGFVYAIAHVRGGKEKGYGWYRDGRGRNKTNTFTDFLAVAEHLGREGLVARDRIIAQGGSAGGMLMGAVANMRPDLFAGIIAQVPFVDVLNTMLDDTLPLTPPEWPEWGNPIASKEDYERIASYSPYDNVTDQVYPAILAIGGLTDPRVTYWEPAKWVAKLRELARGPAPILLKTNMEAGHGGASGRFDRLKEVAITQAFALWVARDLSFAALD